MPRREALAAVHAARYARAANERRCCGHGPCASTALGVRGRDVADVGREPVTGVERVEPAHEPVARHLGDDRGRGDRRALRVPVDDGGVRRRERAEPEPVDEARLGGRMQVGEHHPEAPEVRAVQSPPVDLARRDDAHRDPRRRGEDDVVEPLALLGLDLLRVVEERQPPDPVAPKLARSPAGRPPRPAARRASRARPRPPPRRTGRRAGGRSGGVADPWRPAPPEDSPRPRTGPCPMSCRLRTAGRSRRRVPRA